MTFSKQLGGTSPASSPGEQHAVGGPVPFQAQRHALADVDVHRDLAAAAHARNDAFFRQERGAVDVVARHARQPAPQDRCDAAAIRSVDADGRVGGVADLRKQRVVLQPRQRVALVGADERLAVLDGEREALLVVRRHNLLHLLHAHPVQPPARKHLRELHEAVSPLASLLPRRHAATERPASC